MLWYISIVISGFESFNMRSHPLSRWASQGCSCLVCISTIAIYRLNLFIQNHLVPFFHQVLWWYVYRNCFDAPIIPNSIKALQSEYSLQLDNSELVSFDSWFLTKPVPDIWWASFCELSLGFLCRTQWIPT